MFKNKNKYLQKADIPLSVSRQIFDALVQEKLCSVSGVMRLDLQEERVRQVCICDACMYIHMYEGTEFSGREG